MRQLEHLEKTRERHGDPFPLRLVGGRRMTVVGDPGLAREVFQAPADVLCAGAANRSALGWLLGEHSLVLLDGERHTTHRRLLLPPLHGPRLERHAEAIRALCEKELDALPEGREVEALPAMRALTLDVVTRVLFGAGEDERRGSLREGLRDLLEEPHPAESEARVRSDAARRAERLVGEEVAGRRGRPTSAEHGDLCSLLLEARDETGAPLSDAEIRDELLTLVVAGAETTAGSLAWALERLARTPAALERAAEEAAGTPGPYIDAVIRETLRMRPPVPMPARRVEGPFSLAGRSIPPGEIVAVSALLIHHRPDLYPDPSVFRPERFLEGKPRPYAWIPFGGGGRRCIGANLALLEMRIALSTLLSRTTPSAVDPAPERARNRANTMVPARGARVVLEPRSPGSPWSAAASWSGEALHREVFFFGSQEAKLYGSLFAAAEPTRPYGVVTCQSWGTDADRSDPLLRSVALAMAELGGAGMVFHYPGFGDSFGDPSTLTLAELGEAARDAAAEAARRRPGLSWIFAGFMLGASVAALAQPQADVERLLLVQPALRPGAYFRRLAERSEPLAPGPSPRAMMAAGATPGMAYGYPIPHRIAADPAQADVAVAAALAAFDGEGTIVRHEAPPEDDPAPARFERLSVPGKWRFGSQNHPRLAAACSDWLEQCTRSGR